MTEEDPFLVTLTPEQREWRLKKIAASADDADYIVFLTDDNERTAGPETPGSNVASRCDFGN